jgi:hypothetical protein
MYDARAMTPFDRREDRVAFELHRTVARKLIDSPDGVRGAIPAGVDRIRQNARGPLVAAWLDEWVALSSATVGSIVDVLIGTDEHSIEMRKNSPFAGVLSQSERLEAIARATGVDLSREIFSDKVGVD